MANHTSGVQRVTVYLPADLLKQLDRLAVEADRSLTAQVRVMLAESVANTKKGA